MITITTRSAAEVNEPTLAGLEATLTTETAVYSLSTEPLLDGSSRVAGGLFGAITWPHCQFNVAAGVCIQQHVLLPNDGLVAAFSWQLRRRAVSPVRLDVRPVFAGCQPRSYRDRWFHFQPGSGGGRLAWLSSVLGPTIFADTNGQYVCEPPVDTHLITNQNVIVPGRFQFNLSDRPSVLILTNDRIDTTRSGQFIGTFLAGLLSTDSLANDVSAGCEKNANLVLAA